MVLPFAEPFGLWWVGLILYIILFIVIIWVIFTFTGLFMAFGMPIIKVLIWIVSLPFRLFSKGRQNFKKIERRFKK